jgi:hypothetical protein
MPIELQYSVPGVVQAAFAGSQGAAAEDVRWRQAQMDQRQQLADADLEARYSLAAIQARLERQRMGQQQWQYEQGLGLEYDQLGAQQQQQQANYELAQQEIDQRGQASDNTFQSALAREAGQMARAAEKRKFEMFMADVEHLRTKQLTPQQRAEAEAQLEQHYGFDMGMPERIVAQQEAESQEAAVQRWRSMLTAPDGSGEMIADEATIDLLMQMEPKEALAAALKEKSEWRQRQAQTVKAEQEQAKASEYTANIQRDDERALQENARKAEAAQQKMEFDRQQAEQKLKLDRQANIQKSQMAAFSAAFKAWSMKQKEGLDAGTEPKFEDYVKPVEDAGDGGVKTVASKADYDALPSGAEYISAKTGRRARKP